TIAPPEEFNRLYFRLGFLDLTRLLIFWRDPNRLSRLPEADQANHAESSHPEGESTSHESDLVQSLFADE
ncbi:MAG: hypothetical protein JW910_10310, partial [Anaerolineae bacterium]|nr:hypothetical protein [Anaerolineae bacterium]